MRKDPQLALQQKEGLNVGYIAFNVEKKPFDNKLVRQALNMAVDRAAILKGLYAGRGQFLNTVTGKNVANTMDPGPYPYDPAKAKALLAEAGFEDVAAFVAGESVVVLLVERLALLEKMFSFLDEV